MTTTFEVPTSDDLDRIYSNLNNWGRWGDDDELGTLNYLTPQMRVEAARLVNAGWNISLSHNVGTEASPENPRPAQHHMLASGDARDSNGIDGYEAARDFLGLDVHGLSTTHVDALSHMFVNGQMFGGRPATEVRSDGARSNTVMAMAEGLVGRGVLLDIPGAVGVDFIDSGAVVSVADLETAEARAGLRVGPGDILLIRWGRQPRRRAKGGFDGMAGLHPECLPWLQDRQIAVLGSDGISDPMPFLGIPGWPFPVHQIGITAMGLHLIDNMSLDPITEACGSVERWAFLFVMAPLRLERATGCPVNPIAVL